jgi:hypothetical protein
MRLVLLAVLFACHTTTPAPPDLATLGAPGLRNIDPKALQADTLYLASDALAGRYPGSDGDRAAEQYIADAFRSAGLQPAGDAGTYFQTVPLREANRIDAQSSLVIHGRGGDVELISGKDAALFADPHSGDVSIDAPLVFVGYGLATPGYDDLAGLDLHGAIALVYGGAPRAIGGKPLNSAEHAVLADVKERTLALRDHGARAVIVIYDPARAERMPFSNWVKKVWGGSMAWLEHGEVRSLPVMPSVAVDEAVIDRVHPGMHAIWQQLDRGQPAKLDLGATVSLRLRSEIKDVTARNVVGLLPGSDPALAAETIVYTAHHDHIGVGPPVANDAIYNGALDDAIGVAGVIAIAHAFAALPQRPRRSILFLAVTAEEKGLLGSDYFAAHPTIPIERIVADINIDGLSPLYEQFDIVALGAEHSSLAGDAAAAARATGYVISPDPDPDQVYFIRSDQYSFVKHGVPSVFPGAGWRDAHGDTATNKAIGDKWGAEHYHQPSDEWRPEYRAEWAAKEAGFDFLLGLSVAMAAERPHWNPGDAFANMQSRSATPAVTGR